MKGLLDRLTKKYAIRIRTINAVMIVLATLLALLLFRTTMDVSQTYTALENASERYFVCESAANELKDASNYLTAQIRMFAVRREAVFMDDYLEEIEVRQRREQALETLRGYLETLDARQYLELAMKNSNELAQREYYVLKLVCSAEGLPTGTSVDAVELTAEDQALPREAKLRKGVELVTDSYYHQLKEYIDENVQLCIDTLTSQNRSEEEQAGRQLQKLFTQQRLLSAALLALVVLVIASNALLVISPLGGFVSYIADHQPLPLKGAFELQYLSKAYNRMFEENLRKSAELRYQAEHDPLTGLFNRGAFEKLREEHTEGVALLIIDVDHFKGFNDNYGHELGDRVLIKVATLLNNSFRFSDYPCRIGGDEFAVIMTGMEPKLSRIVLDKVDHVRRGLQDTSDGLPPVTLSIGVAFSERKSVTGDLFKDADAALYRVKERGRNGCAIFGMEE